MAARLGKQLRFSSSGRASCGSYFRADREVREGSAMMSCEIKDGVDLDQGGKTEGGTIQGFSKMAANAIYCVSKQKKIVLRRRDCGTTPQIPIPREHMSGNPACLEHE
jgi:hypothetical protein